MFYSYLSTISVLVANKSNYHCKTRYAMFC